MREIFKKWEKRELLEKGARAIVEAIFKDGLLGPVDELLSFWVNEKRFTISNEYLGDTMIDVAPISIFRECGSDDEFRAWAYTEAAPERIVERLREAISAFESDFYAAVENE
ncbi:MAG: hypothetical protein J6W10_01955 [Kiritimatiellae bacterium]|nr:hypothetical protein [Kiritimatiellia bacterium]